MNEHGLPTGPITDLRRLGGGTQNVMLRLSRGGRTYVLRRPPINPRPSSNSSMLREVRVLTALQNTPLPVPRIVAACTDTTVLDDVVFYLMDAVDGFSPEIELPDNYRTDADARHLLGLEAARAAATLGQIDVDALGLTDLGRPDGFLGRQVTRWLGELDSYRQLPGYPGPDLPHLAPLADWLERNRPGDAPPGLMHGDFHLANLLYRRDTPCLAAVTDWEMVTVGDPLLDLGWLIATWPGDDWDGVFGGTPIMEAGGLPQPQELIVEYLEHSSRDLAAIDWYVVLACFKLAILLEGTHARACAGMAEPAVGDRLHGHAVALLERGYVRRH